MENDQCYEIETLPELYMYGGSSFQIDAIPYEDDGSRMSEQNASQCTATLSVSYLSTISGLGNNGTRVPPVLIKSGNMELDDHNDPFFQFLLIPSDTVNLRGKFIYQISVENGNSAAAVSQGLLNIRMNNNQ